jgi:hypothetical protein
MLGTIFGKLYDFDLEKKKERSVGEWDWGQASFAEGWFTLDHILTLQTSIEQETCANLSSCFIDSKKTSDTISHDKFWEYLQCLGEPLQL